MPEPANPELEPRKGAGDRDATDRELRESEERLRLAVAATGIGIWDVNGATGERGWSPEFKAILGLPPEAVPDTELFSSLIHPADRERVTELYAMAYASPEHASYQAEFRVRRANDHTERWVVTTGRIYFDDAGKPVRGIGTLRDIHERRVAQEAVRISEERHRLAIEATDLGTWDFDMVADVHRWSPEFKRLWGLPPETPSERPVLHPLVDDEGWARIRAAWAKAADPAGDGRVEIEYEIRRADDGARRWVHFRGQVFFDEGRKRPLRAIGIMMDTTDRRQSEERQRLLLHELNHRVRNTFALVQAIVGQTLRSTTNAADASERILARLMALSNTHNLLTATSWTGAGLTDILNTELTPYRSQGDHRVRLRGGTVELGPQTALTVGLIVHELAANAAKYGSLSVPEGRLEVVWEVSASDEGRRLVLDWQEAGGPPVTPPTRQGFGSKLIERGVAGDLAGKIDLDYAPGGFRCRLTFALRPDSRG